VFKATFSEPLYMLDPMPCVDFTCPGAASPGCVCNYASLDPAICGTNVTGSCDCLYAKDFCTKFDWQEITLLNMSVLLNSSDPANPNGASEIYPLPYGSSNYGAGNYLFTQFRLFVPPELVTGCQVLRVKCMGWVNAQVPFVVSGQGPIWAPYGNWSGLTTNVGIFRTLSGFFDSTSPSWICPFDADNGVNNMAGTWYAAVQAYDAEEYLRGSAPIYASLHGTSHLSLLYFPSKYLWFGTDWPERLYPAQPCVDALGLPCLNDGQEVIVSSPLSLFVINYTGPCPHNLALWGFDKDEVVVNPQGVFLWSLIGWMWDIDELGFGPLLSLEAFDLPALAPYTVYLNAGMVMTTASFCPVSGSSLKLLANLVASSDSLGPGYTFGYHADSSA